MMYFLKGVLPWQGLKVDKKEDRYKKIYEKKKSTSPEELSFGCARKYYFFKFLAEFCTYIQYTRALTFEQNPDYDYLRGLLKKIMDNNKITLDGDFDWVIKNKDKTNNVKLKFKNLI